MSVELNHTILPATDNGISAEFLFGRIRNTGVNYEAASVREKPGEINRRYGGRGVYLVDPDSHLMEVITQPDGPSRGMSETLGGTSAARPSPTTSHLRGSEGRRARTECRAYHQRHVRRPGGDMAVTKLPSSLQTGRRRPFGGMLVLLFAAFAGLVLSACGDDDSTVGVTLQEFSVTPDEESIGAGEVKFEVENEGAETHEFVVLRTDLEPGDLPTAEDGSVDEEGSGIEVVDEAEEIPSGDSVDLTVDLDAGSYVLICNVVEEEDGETESHYQQGMRVGFTAD